MRYFTIVLFLFSGVHSYADEENKKSVSQLIKEAPYEIHAVSDRYSLCLGSAYDQARAIDNSFKKAVDSAKKACLNERSDILALFANSTDKKTIEKEIDRVERAGFKRRRDFQEQQKENK